MESYQCDVRSRYHKSIDLQIDLMVLQISNHFSIRKMIKTQQKTQKACVEYHHAHRRIAKHIQEIHRSLEDVDTQLQRFDVNINKIQKKYNLDNHRSRPSSSHPQYRPWRRLVFERLELQCSAKQPILFSKAIQMIGTRIREMRIELHLFCLKVTNMIKRKSGELEIEAIEELDDKLVKRQTYYQSSRKLLEDQIKKCSQRKVQLFCCINQLTTNTMHIISLLSQRKITL